MPCPTCGHEPNPPAGLTEEERDLMRILVECFDADGITPTYEALCREMSIGSKSKIKVLVDGCERKGWLKRQHGSRRGRCRRGLHILHRPPMPDFTTPEFRLAAAG